MLTAACLIADEANAALPNGASASFNECLRASADAEDRKFCCGGALNSCLGFCPKAGADTGYACRNSCLDAATKCEKGERVTGRIAPPKKPTAPRPKPESPVKR